MTIVTIKVHDTEARALLDDLARRGTDLAQPLADIGEELVQRAKARFGTSQGPDGQPWRPKKVPDGRKTLVGETGTLRRQIAYRVVGRTTLVVTASAPYAAIHQFGGTSKRAGGQQTIRHRTDAKGQLVRRTDLAAFGGRGLVFAKASHKRALARQVQVGPYQIRIPARPFMPVQPDGRLYPAEAQAVRDTLAAWLKPRE